MCTAPLLHAPQSSLQRKPGHVGWHPFGPTPLTPATRNVRRTSDWVCWVGQVRMVRKLERVGWTHPGPRHRSRRPGYGSSNASDGPAGPTPPVAATRLRTLDRVGRCPTGPGHRSRLPGYGRSTASAEALWAQANGCGYLFAPDRACGGRCLVLEMEISAHEVRCPGHAAAGHGLVTGPGWFRHYQHRLGQTGVGVGEPVLRLLRRDDPSHSAIGSVKFQVSRTPKQGLCQSVPQ